MPGKLFISQAAIDSWVSTDKVDLQGELLKLRGGAGALRLRAASLFRRVAGDGDDRRRLIGKVKDEDALAALGAEAYMTSVLFDDTAYDVEAGFLAIPLDGSADNGSAVLAAVHAVTS